MTLLTADDVLQKTFQQTKFREGYDQDEVDDFLDEIVNTLRVLSSENAELKAKLEAGGAASDETGLITPVQDATVENEPESEATPEPEPEAAPEPEATPEPEPTAPVAAAAVTSDPESATGMLQLAQRLHDEYVRNGKDEGDRLVSEAKSEAERLVSEAEGQRARTLKQLESEQATLEHKISQLRSFERDYRMRLKSFLGSLVETLDAQASVVGVDGGTPQL
ncbi:DivIVA domain-containing protein [Serinibacter salmoneus]|uniref:Cell wall synthesis protein Wag31 n=1 Tax=Serinibacter salmoneus TaxID=556530 RepID=A0A2A9CY87_9MICO|nr:DivIVA domain-containing protein [Serinibacter salmoneus]PFG19394.1 DivIVA domain-containing protein [Serinibacter salmoneus]